MGFQCQRRVEEKLKLELRLRLIQEGSGEGISIDCEYIMLAEVAALQAQFKTLPLKHVELMDALRAVCWLQALLLHMIARLRRCPEPPVEAGLWLTTSVLTRENVHGVPGGNLHLKSVGISSSGIRKLSLNMV
ncbi:hypothetical protein Droror1_Dr00025178 [Drosera rotundifolia]